MVEGVSNTRAVADVEAGSADYTTLITSPNLTLLASRLAAHYGPGSAAAGNVPIYPVTPDIAKARELAGHKRRNAVLYTCTYPQCAEQAQIITNNLRAIGIAVHVKTFKSESVGEHANKPGAPYDLAETGWGADYPDPSSMLWSILEDKRSCRRLTMRATGADSPPLAS